MTTPYLLRQAARRQPAAALTPAPELAPWCQTCGNPVENGMCACWCHIAEALQRFAGIDFDASAQLAADLWRREADPERVWSAEYAGDHDVETYPDTRRFAPAGVREADRLAFPHDDDCPVCGRRQWGGPDPYVTCTACGYVGPEF